MKNKYLKIISGIFPIIFLGNIVAYWIASLNGIHNEVSNTLGMFLFVWIFLGIVYMISFIVYSIKGKVSVVDVSMFIIVVILTPLFLMFLASIIDFFPFI